MQWPVTPTQSKFKKYRRCPRRSKSGEQSEGLPPSINIKSTDIVDRQIKNFLHDLPFSRNQPFELAVDKYIRILK